ncbi:MAG: hypothetical protein HQL95_00550 [Magnetococcales bacterium]|nr:hypothetical protein [Magnetococcales bacterium]
MTELPPTLEPWTPELVKARLEQAAQIERRRPERHVRPDGARSSWPAHQIQRDFDLVEVLPPCPTPQEIIRAEEAMGWLRWVPSAGVRRMLWSLACGSAVRTMMTEYRRGRKTIDRLCASGLKRIANRLNARERR